MTWMVSDLAATRDFYVNLLGMQESPRPDFDFEGAWFQVGNVQIHAIVTSEIAGRAGWGDRGVIRPNRGHHFAFQVIDIESAAGQANEPGIEVAAELKQRPDGARQLFVLTPTNT